MVVGFNKVTVQLLNSHHIASHQDKGRTHNLRHAARGHFSALSPLLPCSSLLFSQWRTFCKFSLQRCFLLSSRDRSSAFPREKNGADIPLCFPRTLPTLLLVSYPKDKQIKNSFNVTQCVVHMKGLSLPRNCLLVQWIAGQGTNG